MIFEVKGQSLTIDCATVAEGAKSFATFVVRADKSWKKLNITARFQKKGDSAVYDVAGVEAGGYYYIPSEVLTKGFVEVALIGVKGKGTVATTEKREFEVKESVAGGITPTTTVDAYAAYVSEVTRLKKRCESAEKRVKEAEEEIRVMAGECKNALKEIRGALTESRDILANVSGAFDAVALALREVGESEKRLLDKHFELSASEKKRERCESLRSIAEQEREKKERERREAEDERALIASALDTAEKARALREKTMKDELKSISERIERVEEREITYFKEKVECADSPFRLTEKTLEYIPTGETLYLPTPLRKIGGYGDEIEITKDFVKVIRRLEKITLKGDEDIIDGVVILPTPAKSELSESVGDCTTLSYGEEVFAKGELLFFPSFEEESLRSFLKESETEVVYPVHERSESFLAFSIPENESYTLDATGKTTKFLKKNITDTLFEIKNKLDKEKNYEHKE